MLRRRFFPERRALEVAFLQWPSQRVLMVAVV